MKKVVFKLSILVLFFHSCIAKKATEKTDVNNKIDSYVNKVMKEFEIPGMALAIVKNDEIIHKSFYGISNFEHNVPVSKKTLFKVHSLTKIIVSTAIFQLIQEGKIKLEEPIGKYFNKFPENWKAIQVKHLLSHSSGLPVMKVHRNLSEKEAKDQLFKAPILFKAGNRYAYNRTNFWILQQLLEKITNERIEDFIIKNQFKSVKKGISFSGDILDVVPNRVTEYYPDEKYEPKIFDFYLPDYLLSAGSLSITLDNFINWSTQFDTNSILKTGYKEQMLNPFLYTNGSSFFSYGWMLGAINKFKTIGFTGGGVSIIKKIPVKNLTIILLSNGYRYDPYIERVANNMLSLVDNSLKVKESWLSEELEIAFNKSDNKKINTLINNNKELPIEKILNEIGYSFIHAIHPRIEKAIEVFIMNTKIFPKSLNTFDSLAEGYSIQGDLEKAIYNYQKALEINEGKDKRVKNNIEKRIQELRIKTIK
ncbi:serine hydrolase [Tenacibaculum sp. 190524A02b]|uniref:Beta-lactamase-related domain-containing protein n=1 Tax=Tenacibaculum vairaonense TaxID=3137860 RepID=A0ABM9PP53_9FLAO